MGKTIWRKLAAGLLCGLLCLPMGMAAAAEQPLSQTGREALEQSLEGDVPGKVVYAKNGLIVRTHIIRENGLTYQYPQVRLVGKKEVSEKISRYFAKKAKVSRNNYRKADKGEEKLTSKGGYVVSYHGPKYLSIIEYTFSYYERAAHPSSWEHGVTFNLENGEPVPWKQLVARKDKGTFTLTNINKALWATEYGQGGYFFSDFTGLKKLPENYYLDNQGHICFVFNQYEIAPYSTGIINLNMEKGV